MAPQARNGEYALGAPRGAPPIHMLARLGHGLLVGATLCGCLGFVESILVLIAFPYHRDWALWSQVMPAYFLAGILLGATVSWVLPWLSDERDRKAGYGPLLAAGVAAILAAVYLVYRLHAHWLSSALPSFSLPALAATVGMLLVSAFAFGLARRFARSRYGWRLTSFFQPFTCYIVLALLLLLALIGRQLPVQKASWSQRSEQAAASGSPNVLLVVLDTVRADRLGCYGHFRPTSPQLDALAAEGVLFQNAFAAAPWTLPSHASLFTGLHPTSHGAGWEDARLEEGRAEFTNRKGEGFLTLAEELSRRGYDTCAVANKAWITFESGLTQGFQKVWDFRTPAPQDRFFLNILLDRLQFRFESRRQRPRDKGAKKIIDQATDWLAQGRGREEDRPFFLFVNLNEAHDPFQPPKSFAGKFLPEGISVQEAQQLDQSTDRRKAFDCGSADFVDREPETLHALYDAEIRYQDQQLGRLFKALRESGLMEDTLVMVTSDHGEEFGEKGRLGHQLCLEDSLIRVPLILRYPKRMRAGIQVSHLASLVDIFPTVLDLVEQESGHRPPVTPGLQALEGVSLLPAAVEDGVPVRDFIIAHYANPMAYLRTFPCFQAEQPEVFPLLDYGRTITVLRGHDYKFFRYGDGRRRLVDLQADPGETQALSEAMQGPQADLMARFDQRLTQQLNAYQQRRLILLSPLYNLWGLTRRSGWRQLIQQTEQLGYVGSEEPKETEAQSLVPPPFLNRPGE
ncbi:MAG: DUF229 domain-containing protein [Planctomycetota bacterium]|nr:MAG: DUF229 domain-containing protein [Planctomycetota bacterium]